MPSRAKRIKRDKLTGKLFIEIPTDRLKQDCQICGKPMLVANGQVAKYHKECRHLRHNKK